MNQIATSVICNFLSCIFWAFDVKTSAWRVFPHGEVHSDRIHVGVADSLEPGDRGGWNTRRSMAICWMFGHLKHPQTIEKTRFSQVRPRLPNGYMSGSRVSWMLLVPSHPGATKAADLSQTAEIHWNTAWHAIPMPIPIDLRTSQILPTWSNYPSLTVRLCLYHWNRQAKPRRLHKSWQLMRNAMSGHNMSKSSGKRESQNLFPASKE